MHPMFAQLFIETDADGGHGSAGPPAWGDSV